MTLFKRAAILATVLLLTTVQGALAQQYISDVLVIGGKLDETRSLRTQKENEGWTFVDYDLNKGAGGKYIYLMYKAGSASSGCITDFYLRLSKSNVSGSGATVTHEGRTYHLADCAGPEDFVKGSHGDLNSGAGGKYIHLFYTRDSYSPGKFGRGVSKITFDNVPTNSVGENGGSTPCDVNNGARGEYIYMHVVKAATDNPLVVHDEAELNEAVTLCANIRVVQNITLTKMVDVYYPVTLSIDLYGNTINRNLTASAGGSGHVLQIRGGSDVTLKDSRGGGKLTGGFADNGGGVWIGSTSTFTMESGAITGCRVSGSEARGGGICNNGTLKLKGNPVISGNYTNNDVGSDIFLPAGKKLTMVGRIWEGAHIGIVPADPISVFSTGYKKFNLNDDPDRYFFISADPANYGVTLVDGELVQYQKVAAMNSYYIDMDGNKVDVRNCRKVSALEDVAGVKMVNGWYVVDANTTIGNRIEVAGIVNIILADGFRFDAKKGLHVPKNVTLHVWGQTEGSGYLYANEEIKDYVAGIGENRSGKEGRDAEPSGEINFHGGKVMAYGGKYSPGIGGNFGQDITITGGLVNASGGELGAGIGCGWNSMTPRNITITGGTVVAFATDGAGIGSGAESYNHWGGEVPTDGTFNTIRITGGKVQSFSGNGAGIGGGSYVWGYDGCEGFVIIEGGTVRAGVGVQPAPDEDVPFHKPQAIGHGGWATWTYDDPGFIRWHVESEIYPNAKVEAQQYSKGEFVLVPAARRIEALRWSVVEISPCDHPGVDEGATCPYCGITGLILPDNADNRKAISENEGKTMDVILSGRTLWKDGSWNTICLPFNLPSLEGTPLEGATVKHLAGSSFSDGVLTLSFDGPDRGIKAGVSYLVKWDGGDPVIKPTFRAVTIQSAIHSTNSPVARFVGTYKPENVNSSSGRTLYLGADNKLFRATADLNVNAFRGYFVLGSDVNPAAVRSVVMAVDETPSAVNSEPEE